SGSQAQPPAAAPGPGCRSDPLMCSYRQISRLSALRHARRRQRSTRRRVAERLAQRCLLFVLVELDERCLLPVDKCAACWRARVVASEQLEDAEDVARNLECFTHSLLRLQCRLRRLVRERRFAHRQPAIALVKETREF